jgi:hypothetical protein
MCASAESILPHDNICYSRVVNTITNAGANAYGLATPWFDNGNIIEYTKGQSTSDKFSLVRIHFLHLSYLIFTHLRSCKLPMVLTISMNNKWHTGIFVQSVFEIYT